jgi:glucokinase
MGECAGDALATATTLLDALVVVGGGLSGAADLFLPALVDEMNGPLATPSGDRLPRMEVQAFNLEDPDQRTGFLKGGGCRITVPGSSREIAYDPLKRIGVGLSRLGTGLAVGVGAYAFALDALDASRRSRT